MADKSIEHSISCWEESSDIELVNVPARTGRFSVLGGLVLKGIPIDIVEPDTSEPQIDKPKIGRPKECRKRMGNFTNRLLLGFANEHYGRRFSWAMMEKLIHILKSPVFEKEDVADSLYLLRQLEPVFLPEAKMASIKFSSGRTAHYFPLEEIANMILDSEELANGLIQTWNDSEMMGGVVDAIGFRVYQDYKKLIDPSNSSILFLFGLFADEYRQKACRGRMVTGVEFFVCNTAKHVRAQTTRVY